MVKRATFRVFFNLCYILVLFDVGILYGAGGLGPLFGYALGAASLKLFTNPWGEYVIFKYLDCDNKPFSITAHLLIQKVRYGSEHGGLDILSLEAH